MFCGEQKESKYKIKVPDLSPVGFCNELKYVTFSLKILSLNFRTHQGFLLTNLFTPKRSLPRYFYTKKVQIDLIEDRDNERVE